MAEIEIFLSTLIGSGIGIGAILFGLSKWLGSVWAERIKNVEQLEHEIKLLKENATVDTIAREQQATIDERLKKVEQEHVILMTKDEHFHQISQETYQNLFARKLTIYEDVANLLTAYDEFIQPDFQLPDSYESRYFSRFLDINNFIRTNTLFFSSKLVEQNLAIYKNIQSKLQKYEVDRQILIEEAFCYDLEFQIEMENFKVKKFDELYEFIKEDINSLIDTIYSELQSITQAVNFIMDSRT